MQTWCIGHVDTADDIFPHYGEGVPRRQPHRYSGLATLPSVGAIPLVTPYCVDRRFAVFCVYMCLYCIFVLIV